MTRAFLPHMRKEKWGRVLFSSSITSHRPSGVEFQSIYCATKGALNAFARAVANETGRDGVTANSLILGIWWTEMLVNVAESMGPEKGKAMSEALASMTSIGRLGNAEELEGLVQLLASDAGSYITGTESVIDGAMDVMFKPIVSNH